MILKVFFLLFPFFLLAEDVESELKKIENDQTVAADVKRGDLLFEIGNDPLSFFYYLKAYQKAPRSDLIRERIQAVDAALLHKNGESPLKRKFLAKYLSFDEMKGIFLLLLIAFFFSLVFFKRWITYFLLLPSLFVAFSLFQYVYLSNILAVVIEPSVFSEAILPKGELVSIYGVKEGKVIVVWKGAFYSIEPSTIKALPL